MEQFRAQPVKEDSQEERPGDWRRFALDIVETVILSMVLFLGINAVSARIRIESISMLPTLQPGNFVIVNKLAYRLNPAGRGDIIVFRLPQDQSQRYIKRIIGLPGEEVRIQNGAVLIDGQRIVEPYLEVPTNRGGVWQVSEGHYFVMGDNRNNSSDSRVWGLVPFDNVIGKALFVYWPPTEWGVLNELVYAASDP
jgi:signal peptidase I